MASGGERCGDGGGGGGFMGGKLSEGLTMHHSDTLTVNTSILLILDLYRSLLTVGISVIHIPCPCFKKKKFRQNV